MSYYPIDHLNKLYENFPRELRYILDERIEELLNTLPKLQVTFDGERFVLNNEEKNITTQFNNDEKKDYYNLPPLNLEVVPCLVNHVNPVSPYVHLEPNYTKNIAKQFDIEETNSITHKESLNN